MFTSGRLCRMMMAGVLAGSAGVLGGCLIDSHSHRTTTGTYVGSQTLAQIEPQHTRKDFVLAVLGEPTCRTTLDDNCELWRWNYTSRKTSDGHVFLVLDSSSVQETQRTTFVQFRDGVVTKVWQD